MLSIYFSLWQLVRSFWFRSIKPQPHFSSMFRFVIRAVTRFPREHGTRRFVSTSLLGCSSFSLFAISILLCLYDFSFLSLSPRYNCILSSSRFSFLLSITRFSTNQHAYDFSPVYFFSFFLCFLEDSVKSPVTRTHTVFMCAITFVLVVVSNLYLGLIDLLTNYVGCYKKNLRFSVFVVHIHSKEQRTWNRYKT